MAKHLMKLCSIAHTYFDPRERKNILQELLPFFSTNELSNAFIVVGALNALFPSHPAPEADCQLHPEHIFPTLFHLWSIVNRSKMIDSFFIDLFSRMARDHMTCDYVRFGAHGIFTKAQSDLIFSAVLRLTQIPVGQANSPYAPLDYFSGSGMHLEKDKKKHPVSYMIARWIVSSLSPDCASKGDSIMVSLEGLLESIETFFHPSNQGPWGTMLGQLILYLTDSFVSRWNREQSGELDLPQQRKIDRDLKRRFVLALRDVTFMGIFSKSSRASSCYIGALQGLAYLEPDIILPRALQQFYPSLQGLVEVHRTTSSINGLQSIAGVMTRLKGYRCHVTALLALALPGIDANDLSKTQITLNFIQSVAYSIPMVPLNGEEGSPFDTALATQWVQGEMNRMEIEGQNVQVNYASELSDEDEIKILRSSTAGLGEFVAALLDKVFTLLENLPDANQVRSSTPEDNVSNALPAALGPLFANLSPGIFDMVLDKLASFISSHVVHQARDAMAWILNAFCQVNPQKTLKVFIPMLVAGIRNEIDLNGAASDRTSGTDYLPRDRALAWNISMLAMCVVHVGREVINYKDELLSIALYMQEKCRGLPTILVSNYIHHLLLNLTNTYAMDHGLFEPDVVSRGLDVADWGATTSPADLTIRWHQPSPEEVEFAVQLFASQTRTASERLRSLMSDDPPVSRAGKNKEWSDEVSRLLQQIRLGISGIATLFDPKRASRDPDQQLKPGAEMATDGPKSVFGRSLDLLIDDGNPLAEAAEDEELRPQFRYKDGYVLDPEDPAYEQVHELRDQLGNLLTETHSFLCSHQEDDVTCFTTLYSAYRTWITDVGIERSAHPSERHLRLYKADIAAFKIKGLRKVYPRPLLVRRAEAYYLLRLKHNASARQKSELDKQLLLDLAKSSLSSYADVRRVAQGAQDSSLKVLIGGKPLVIPVVLEGLRTALIANDHDRIKGGMFTLFFTTLARTLVKDWRFAPDVMRLYIETAGIDKPSIQKLGSSALFPLMDFGKPLARARMPETQLLEEIKPIDNVAQQIQARHEFIMQRHEKVEVAKGSLGLELTRKARGAHWKIASRCAIFATNLCVRFGSLAPPEFVDLVSDGVNDAHPNLRNIYLTAFTTVFTTVDMRAIYGHDYNNYLAVKEVNDTNRLQIPVTKGDADFTKRFLEAFTEPNGAEYLVDFDHPGWLVWGDKFTAYRSQPLPFEAYDEVENKVRAQIGGILTRQWVSQCFDYLKQEPRDSSTDKFRITNAYMLMHVFDLMHYGRTSVTFDDVKELTLYVYGDGSDKHQHRATSEILGALLAGSSDDPSSTRDRVWRFAAPFLLHIIADALTPENLQYWSHCLHLVLDSKDPRRSHELIDGLRSFRLDMFSNAAFKESSKIQLLELAITLGGWHFREAQPILDDFLAHVDHPYKAVRESMGRVISAIFKTRYHESYESVQHLLDANQATSSIGVRPYQPAGDLSAAIRDIFDRLEQWRSRRPPGQQTPSSYTSASKTVLTWLDSTLSSHECLTLVPFFADPFMEQLLYMMDVKEDPELMRMAYHVYRHLPNIPFREGEDASFIQALVRIGKTATSWHQRLRALVNMQVVYFRRIFLTKQPERDLLFASVSDMLSDAQLEVRSCASTTLAGLIRCSPKTIRQPMITQLKQRFEDELRQNPMPKRSPRPPNNTTSIDVQGQITRRHAAVLGLGALVEAFPYMTPPPSWMPEVLATLARRAAGDIGVVGKATKAILSEFKKTRQDSWSVDQKSFTAEQLEDLEGVLWKSYFA